MKYHFKRFSCNLRKFETTMVDKKKNFVLRLDKVFDDLEETILFEESVRVEIKANDGKSKLKKNL